MSWDGAQAIVLPVTGRTERMGARPGRETGFAYFVLA